MAEQGILGTGTDEDRWLQYTTSFYFVFTTITTVGYGDLSPTTGLEQAFAILMMFTGTTLFGYTAGIMSGDTAIIDDKLGEKGRTIDYIELLMNRFHVKGKTKQKMKTHLYFLARQYERIPEEALLTALPYGLRKEITIAVYDSVMVNGLAKCIMFSGMSDDYQAAMLPLLRPCFCGPGDPICTRGEPASEIYLLYGQTSKMEVALSLPERGDTSLTEGRKYVTKPLMKLRSGDTFGTESICQRGMDLPGRPTYLYTVTGVSRETELFRVSAEECLTVLTMWVPQQNRLRARCKKGLQQLLQLSKQAFAETNCDVPEVETTSLVDLPDVLDVPNTLVELGQAVRDQGAHIVAQQAMLKEVMESLRDIKTKLDA